MSIEKLKQLMEQTGFNIKCLSLLTGVHRNTISNYLNKKSGGEGINELIEYLEFFGNESDNYKILTKRLRDKTLKEKDLSHILYLVDEIIEGKESEFRGLNPACAPGEPAGEKPKLKKEGK